MNKCSQCQSELVYIKKLTFQHALEITAANFKTKSKRLYKDFGGSYTLCPACDSYGLGIELNTGFPIFLKSGVCTTIHEINRDLYGP